MATYEINETPSVDPGITLAALAGELDLTNAQELAEQLDELVQDETALVLDLNRVVFIDSAALHCLFRLARTRGPAGIAFVIEPTSPIATTVEIVQLARAAITVTTYDDARSALERAHVT